MTISPLQAVDRDSIDWHVKAGTSCSPSKPRYLNDQLRSALDGATLIRPARLRERIELLDRLERLMFDRTVSDAARLDRARALYARIEAVNEQVFASIRTGIRRGEHQALRQWLSAVDDSSFDVGHPGSCTP